MIAILALLACGDLGSLVAAAATTAPTSRPTTPELFQSLYNRTLEEGTIDDVVTLFLARTPGELSVARVFAENELSLARLAKATQARFDVELWRGGEIVVARPCQWKLDGERATRSDGPHPAPLVRIDGAYCIDLRAWGVDWADDPRKSQEALARHREYRELYDGLRKRVDAGEYWSVEEVRHAAYGRESLEVRPGACQGPLFKLPATRPVTPDLSSPKSAYASVAAAMKEGDGAAFLQGVTALDAKAEAGARAFAHWITAWSRLWRSAAVRYGTENASRLSDRIPIPSPRAWGIELGGEVAITAVRIEKDRATLSKVSYLSGAARRSDEKWKVIFPEEKEGTNTAQLFGAAADFADRFAAEIKAGKHASVEAATKAMDKAMAVEP